MSHHDRRTRKIDTAQPAEIVLAPAFRRTPTGDQPMRPPTTTETCEHRWSEIWVDDRDDAVHLACRACGERWPIDPTTLTVWRSLLDRIAYAEETLTAAHNGLIALGLSPCHRCAIAYVHPQRPSTGGTIAFQDHEETLCRGCCGVTALEIRDGVRKDATPATDNGLAAILATAEGSTP